LELDLRSEADIGAAVEHLLSYERVTHAATQVAAEIAAMPFPADHVATIEALAGKHSSD
jgi:hypothetical protein